MTSEKIDIHNRNLDTRIEALERNKNISKKEKDKLKEFLRLASIGRINLKKKIKTNRLLKYIDGIKIALNFFQDFDNITLQKMEKFNEDLDKDKLTQKNKEPYADSTKADIKKILKIYLKWRVPDKYDELTNWIDTSVKEKTPEYLTEKEIEKLYNACTNAKQRFIIAVSFDLGCRAEEFLNIRQEDVLEPTQEFSYYKITLKQEYSKTKGRNIGAYWKYSSEAIRNYLDEIKIRKRDEPLIKDTYDAIRLWLTRLGKKVLKRRVYAHLFRHSSATYYASKMNRQQLCIRYGWRFTSRMPDLYITRAGVEENEVGEKFKGTEVEALKEKIDKLEHMFKLVLDNGTQTLEKIKKS